MRPDRGAGRYDGPALAPIALFVYNRPEHTRRTVEALGAGILAKQSDLIVYSDAPRTKDHAERVSEVRAYVRQIEGFKSVTVIERETNFGLARSIIDGVTETVNRYGRIIVLEDDLVTAPTFLDYMNSALDKYAQDEQVMQISGYMFPVGLQAKADAFFLPFTSSWGWATWQRAWRYFDAAAPGYKELRHDRARRKSFDLDGAYPYFSMLESQLRGEVDSWAICWWLSVFDRNGLVLYPRQSLVENIGFDGSGTHCGVCGSVQTGLSDHAAAFTLPSIVAVSDDDKRAVYRYLSQSRGQMLGRLTRRLRRLLGIWVK